MSTNKDPRRLPVYIDRVNNRLLADPQNGGPWFVVSAGGGGGSVGPGTTTEAGIVQLEDSVTSNSVTKAATPNSVRQAFSLAETANSVAAGASTNATTALNNSTNALNTANAISDTANQANANASTALQTANAAVNTATNASNAVGGKLDKSGGVVTGDLIIGPTARLGFAGAVDNVFETYIAVEEPTQDRTITLPNASGTVPLRETANTWESPQTFQNSITFANGICNGDLHVGLAGSISFEGSVSDDFETILSVVNPTADRSILLPNASGTLALSESLATVATSGSYVDLSNKPTFGTAAALNVAPAGNASSSQVVKGDDTRLATNLGYNATTRAVTSSTGNSATLPTVTPTEAGLAPASGGGNANFLRADGTWAIPPGVEGTDGDRGDIIVSGGGTSWTVKNGAISYNKMQAVSIGNRLLGKAGSTPGPIEEIPCSQAGRDLIGASTASEQRTFLGLGALAQQDALGFINSQGRIGTLPGRPIITTTDGTLTTGLFGTSAGTFCEGNDARLSDKRNTVNALTFTDTGTGSAPGVTFDGSAARSISFNSIGAAADVHTHGNISSGGAIGTASGLPIVTGVNGVLTTGAFGTTTGTFCQGNDARLSDSRTTPSALTLSSAGDGATSGSTFNGSAARTISFNSIGAASATHSHGNITSGGAIGSTSGLPIITTTSGVLTTGSFGTTAGTFCAGNDGRFSSAAYLGQNQTFTGLQRFQQEIVIETNGGANTPAVRIGSSVNSGFYRETNGSVGVSVDSTRRVTFGTADHFFSNSSSANPGVSINNSGVVVIGNSNQASGWGFLEFRRNNATVGFVSQNGTTAVQYNTTSDYRLKENVVQLTDAIGSLKALQPRRFNFIADPNRVVSGFIAHELQDVVPEAVAGEKDATEAVGILADADGATLQEDVPRPETLENGQTWTATGERPVYQGVDQSKLVPLLTAALQEAVARIERLESLVGAQPA